MAADVSDTIARGAPLPGGDGVAGTILYTWTRPPKIVWQGWLTPNEQYTIDEQWRGFQLQAYRPRKPPADAPPPPNDTAKYTVVRVMPPGGWCSELS